MLQKSYTSRTNNTLDVVTPVDVDELRTCCYKLIMMAMKHSFLVQGFWKGFDLGYRGTSQSEKILTKFKIRIGSKVDAVEQSPEGS